MEDQSNLLNSDDEDDHNTLNSDDDDDLDREVESCLTGAGNMSVTGDHSDHVSSPSNSSFYSTRVAPSGKLE